MKSAAIAFVLGCVVVAIIAVVMLVIHGDWKLFAIVNAVAAVVLGVLAKGAATGADARRPPGAARISGARVFPGDPDKLAAEERALYPDGAIPNDVRAETAATSFGFLLAAVPPAAVAVICAVWVL